MVQKPARASRACTFGRRGVIRRDRISRRILSPRHARLSSGVSMSNVRRLAGTLYRGIAAPFGARALDRMIRDGLPEVLASPLRFLFGAATPRDVVAVAARIEARRAAIASGHEQFQFTYSPSPVGVARWAELAASTSPEPSIPLRRFANNFSVPERWGILLHLFAQHLDARAILELGSCVGISGAYLA